MFSDCFSRCYYKYNILIWQASLQTESSISHLTVRILSKSRQLSRPAPEIRLHLLPIQKRIISVYNSPLHEKRCCSGSHRCCERGSGNRLVSAVCCRSHDIYAWRGKIRLYLVRQAGKSPAGKICIGIIPAVIGSNGNHLRGRGRNRQGGIRRRPQKTGRRIQNSGRRKPEIVPAAYQTDRT